MADQSPDSCLTPLFADNFTGQSGCSVIITPPPPPHPLLQTGFPWSNLSFLACQPWQLCMVGQIHVQQLSSALCPNELTNVPCRCARYSHWPVCRKYPRLPTRPNKQKKSKSKTNSRKLCAVKEKRFKEISKTSVAHVDRCSLTATTNPFAFAELLYFIYNFYSSIPALVTEALATPTIPSQHGWCRPTNSQRAPPDPRAWAGIQTTTGGRTHPARCSSSWVQQAPLRGDTGSWSPGGSHWSSPCHDGRGTELPLLPARTVPTPREPESCWNRNGSVCRTLTQLPHCRLLQDCSNPDVLNLTGMCNFTAIGTSPSQPRLTLF